MVASSECIAKVAEHCGLSSSELSLYASHTERWMPWCAALMPPSGWRHILAAAELPCIQRELCQLRLCPFLGASLHPMVNVRDIILGPVPQFRTTVKDHGIQRSPWGAEAGIAAASHFNVSLCLILLHFLPSSFVPENTP